MTKRIRKKVFETNSSSSHSLTLSKGDLVKQPFTSEQLRDGVVDLTVGDYNWEWHRYYSAENKLRYLLTQVTNGQLPHGTSWDITKELCEENERVAMLVRVVREHTGCDLLIHSSSGGIDHQSSAAEKGTGLELFNSDERLREFLFDPTSYIQTGNDNAAPPWEISTDRGRELAYAEYLAKVPKDYATVKLSPLFEHRDEGYSTGAGGVIGREVMPELFKQLQEQGIVASAHLVCTGSWDRYEGRDVKGHLAQNASAWGGFKLAPGFVGTYEYRHSKDSGKEAATYVVRVPQGLADELAKLDPMGLRNHQVAEAKRELKYWYSRWVENSTDKWNITKVEEAKSLLLKVGGKKALDSVPVPTPKPPKKPAAKKVATKKVAAKKTTAAKTAAPAKKPASTRASKKAVTK